MNKKGFTLVELLGVIVIIAILAGLAVVSISGIINNGKKGVYKNYESTLKGAAQNYFIDNVDDLPAINSSKDIFYTTLLEKKYLDKFDDPNGGDCSLSYVKVSRGANISNNFNLTYKACLICKDSDNITYTSENCN